MSPTAFLVSVSIVWLVIGVISSIVLGRRGHDPFRWGLFGALFGPLVIPMALAEMRREHRPAHVAPGGARGAGPVDVLIGVDGSAEADEAFAAALKLFGPQLGRVAIAGVTYFDAESSLAGRRANAELSALLASYAERVGQHLDHDADAVLLEGNPADALRSYALAESFDIVVVGRRGRGASTALLGSVATALAGESGVPVLIGSPRLASDETGGPQRRGLRRERKRERANGAREGGASGVCSGVSGWDGSGDEQ